MIVFVDHDHLIASPARRPVIYSADTGAAARSSGRTALGKGGWMMRILVSGASGLVGKELTPALQAAGHEVQRLVRDKARVTRSDVFWDPAAERSTRGRWTLATP